MSFGDDILDPINKKDAYTRSIISFLKDLRSHWPRADPCDSYTEELIGGMFASLAGLEKAEKEK